MCGVMVVGLLALLGLMAFPVTTTQEAEPVIAASQSACAVTLPNGMTPPAEEPAPGHHGNGQLYTVLALDGEIRADERFIEADGTNGWKLPIWRALGVGEPGDLEISGHELMTGTAIRSLIPKGYGQRFQASGVYFPGAGCYEVTLRSSDASLTFITRVSAHS